MKNLKYEVWFKPMKGGSPELVATFLDEFRADDYAALRNKAHGREQYYVAYEAA